MFLLNINGFSQNKIVNFSVERKLSPLTFNNIFKYSYDGFKIDLYSKNYVFSIELLNWSDISTLYFVTPSTYYDYLSLLIGKFIGNKYFRFQYQAGISPIWGLEKTNLLYRDSAGFFTVAHYDSEKFFTIGLALDLGVKFIPCRYIGIGIDLQSNLNLKKSFFHPMIGLEIGILRDKINKKTIKN